MKDYHKNIWPEISKSLKDSGIINAEIYNTGNRLFMIIEVVISRVHLVVQHVMMPDVL